MEFGRSRRESGLGLPPGRSARPATTSSTSRITSSNSTSSTIATSATSTSSSLSASSRLTASTSQKLAPRMSSALSSSTSSAFTTSTGLSSRSVAGLTSSSSLSNGSSVLSGPSRVPVAPQPAPATPLPAGLVTPVSQPLRLTLMAPSSSSTSGTAPSTNLPVTPVMPGMPMQAPSLLSTSSSDTATPKRPEVAPTMPPAMSVTPLSSSLPARAINTSSGAASSSSSTTSAVPVATSSDTFIISPFENSPATSSFSSSSSTTIPTDSCTSTSTSTSTSFPAGGETSIGTDVESLLGVPSEADADVKLQMAILQLEQWRNLALQREVEISQLREFSQMELDCMRSHLAAQGMDCGASSTPITAPTSTSTTLTSSEIEGEKSKARGEIEEDEEDEHLLQSRKPFQPNSTSSVSMVKESTPAVVAVDKENIINSSKAEVEEGGDNASSKLQHYLSAKRQQEGYDAMKAALMIHMKSGVGSNKEVMSRAAKSLLVLSEIDNPHL